MQLFETKTKENINISRNLNRDYGNNVRYGCERSENQGPNGESFTFIKELLDAVKDYFVGFLVFTLKKMVRFVVC